MTTSKQIREFMNIIIDIKMENIFIKNINISLDIKNKIKEEEVLRVTFLDEDSDNLTIDFYMFQSIRYNRTLSRIVKKILKNDLNMEDIRKIVKENREKYLGL